MIGAIADDFTGATDVAVAFRRAGMRTLVYFGIPDHTIDAPADAVVIALKTRTVPVDDAVAESTTAARWLQANGATQLYFKYCSTFDSRPEGNIGPVADALADLSGARVTPIVPSSPPHRRTQYMGNLFVGRQLLSESPMRHHPLTPMRKSSVAELLAPQTARPIALLDLEEVREGSAALRRQADALPDRSYAVIDAIDDVDLLHVARAFIDEPLLTGAAGLAAALGAVALERRAGTYSGLESAPADIESSLPGVALAGSCSARTLQQIAIMAERGHPTLHVRAERDARPEDLAAEALAWIDQQDLADGPLVYSSLPPAELREVQERLGVTEASALLETTMGLVARGLVERGVTRIVVAGGETSGAVVQALAVDGAEIGLEAAPGVPWIRTLGPRPLTLLLKSGNFGDENLLADAVGGERVGGLVA